MTHQRYLRVILHFNFHQKTNTDRKLSSCVYVLVCKCYKLNSIYKVSPLVLDCSDSL